MPHTTALLPAGFTAGHIPNLSPEDQAWAAFISRYKNPKTRASRDADVTLYHDWCRQQQVNILDAQPAQIELYLRWLEQTHVAESTISRKFGAVRVYYKRAVIARLIQWDPTAAVDNPKVDKGKQRRTRLQPLEMVQLLKTAQAAGVQEHAVVSLLGESGLRTAEACSLRIEHMTRIHGQEVIRFIGKNSKAATMTLPPSTGEIVRRAIGTRTSGPVVINSKGDAWTPNSQWRLIKRLAKDAGLDPDNVSPHTLRRTCARTLTLLGAPLQQTQALLRHESASTTMLYVGQDNGMADLAAMQISNFYSSLTG